MAKTKAAVKPAVKAAKAEAENLSKKKQGSKKKVCAGEGNPSGACHLSRAACPSTPAHLPWRLPCILARCLHS